ncbi:MAG: glycosyltransferase family 2 protein [Anaerolineae bacterium]|nr:glycosyltransferase family 2 protein [Anaerolineae bacterium]
MTEISVVVLTKNEEANITDCLDSVQWADHVLVLDSLSQDATVKLAREHGAEVQHRAFDDYARQRNAALGMASSEWVFFVDADERATVELADEVRLAIMEEGFAGWWVPRKNYIFGRWIRHAGWYPDYQLRLLRRERARYDERRAVHELALLDGEAGYLRSPLIHYNYDTLAQFREKQSRYTDYEVRMLHESGTRARPWNLLLQPLRQFRWRYLALRGYKEGWLGFLLSALMAYYELVRYWRLWHLQRA